MRVAALLWQNDDRHRVRLGAMVEATAHPILIETGRQLATFLERSGKAFNIPLDLKGTEFQRFVWAALRTIPFGATQLRSDRAPDRPLRGRMRGGCREWPQPYLDQRACHRVVDASGA